MRSTISINETFEVAFLQKIQDSFSDATGFATIIVDYKGNPITKYSNFSDYCLKVREQDDCAEACFRSDAHGGIEAAKIGRAYIYICHGGLVDMAVPIMVKGRYLGAILSGQVRISPKEMTMLPKGVQLPLADFLESPEIIALKEKTQMSTLKQVYASANLLQIIASHLVERRMIDRMEKELHEKNLILMEEVKHRSEMEYALKEADLKTLQTQVNPHFLFNTLNTIGRLAMKENAEKTQEMIYAFSDMMRYALRNEKNKFVSLKEEMDHVRNYLSIQKMRLGDRLQVAISVDERGMNTSCPFMVVQPFVENIINHVIEPRAKGGRIDIETEWTEEAVKIKIRDDGPGIPPDIQAALLSGTYENPTVSKGNGIGIVNTNKRLKYYYGETYGIQINKTMPQGTEVLIRLPQKQAMKGMSCINC